MARSRRGWKRGDWLVRDEESGLVEYASKVRRDYYGVLTKDPDHMHPQDFVRARNDPYVPSSPQNPPEISYDTSAYNVSSFVYGTNVPTPIGPATHIFNPTIISQSDPGIGDMVISTTFVIR